MKKLLWSYLNVEVISVSMSLLILIADVKFDVLFLKKY